MNVLRVGVAALVTVVWAVVYLASVFNPSISAPPELSGVMLAVVTWLMGSAYRKGMQEKVRNTARRLAQEPKDEPKDDDPLEGW